MVVKSDAREIQNEGCKTVFPAAVDCRARAGRGEVLFFSAFGLLFFFLFFMGMQGFAHVPGNAALPGVAEGAGITVVQAVNDAATLAPVAPAAQAQRFQIGGIGNDIEEHGAPVVKAHVQIRRLGYPGLHFLRGETFAFANLVQQVAGGYYPARLFRGGRLGRRGLSRRGRLC